MRLPRALSLLRARALTVRWAARSGSVADAVANLGETEVREALLAKATFFVKLGDKVRVARSLVPDSAFTPRLSFAGCL